MMNRITQRIRGLRRQLPSKVAERLCRWVRRRRARTLQTTWFRALIAAADMRPEGNGLFAGALLGRGAHECRLLAAQREREAWAELNAMAWRCGVLSAYQMERATPYLALAIRVEDAGGMTILPGEPLSPYPDPGGVVNAPVVDDSRTSTVGTADTPGVNSASEVKVEATVSKVEACKRIREAVARRAMWQPRIDQHGKVDQALRQLLVRVAQNEMSKVDKDSTMTLARVVAGLVESVWQDTGVEMEHERSRTLRWGKTLNAHTHLAAGGLPPRSIHPASWLPRRWVDEWRYARRGLFVGARPEGNC